MEIIYDVETCSENYKKYIRSISYGDTISKMTKENMIFNYNKQKYTVKFELDFSFDFENGFHYADFSSFTCSRRIDNKVMDEFVKYIKQHFVTTDRLSL